MTMEDGGKKRRGASGSASSGNKSRIQVKNRAKILNAALTEFARSGYRGATVDGIAQAAGMSKSNLLYYFGSKQAIYKEVLAHILDVWLAPLRTLDPDGDPRKELTSYINQKFKISSENPESSKLFANEVMRGGPVMRPVLEGPLKALVDEKCEVVKGWIDTGKLLPVEPVHLIFIIWATTQHYADFEVQIRALTGKGLENESFMKDAAETLSRVVLEGLLPPQA